MPMPTIPGIPPEVWEQLLQILSDMGTDVAVLTEQGITSFDGLKNWLELQGYELVEISEVVGYTIAKTSAVDPTTTNAVATRVATDITTVGGAGTAVSQFMTGGNRTLGLVSKVFAVGACLSLLVSTIGAGLVTDEIKEDLITSADPYTIDGENVPVLIDENGKTHFLEEMVEAIRAKAIELGVFDTEPGASIPESEAGTALYYASSYYNMPIPIYHGKHCVVGYTLDPGQSYDAEQAEFQCDEDFTLVLIGTNNSGFKTNVFALPSTTARLYVRMNSHRTSTGNWEYGGWAPQSYTNWVNATTRDGKSYKHYSTTAGYGVIGQPLARLQNYVTLIGDGVCPYTYINDSYVQSNHIKDVARIVLYGDISTGDGVEGITPAQDLISAGVADVAKPLTEVLPQLATGQMSIASPTENDLTHKSNWYPVSINSEDVFTDGATEEQTSTATDGDVAQDLQPSIMNAINELIERLNPDGVPDVEVGDSGDTPPENPPLIPPSDVAGSNGLWSIYNPSLQNVNDFGAWLWSDSLADQFKRIFNSPIDGVIGFHMLYCTPITGTAKPIKCGFLQSPVSAPVVTNPYVEINCGNVSINEYYRNAMDYDNTRISVYLPFIGIVPLDTNIVMGSDINITYRIDVLTGTCLAQIKVIKENSDAVMYAFDGNCAVQIPLTATTYTGMIGALLGGISAGASIMTGNMVQAIGSGVRALASGMTGLSGAKQSGTFGANVGALGIRIPYVIITHPVSAMPGQFNKLEGIPSNNTVVLGSLSGYTRVRSVHLENIGKATQEEINMIEELLKEGVII